MCIIQKYFLKHCADIPSEATEVVRRGKEEEGKNKLNF